jgi:transcriptional antiterminator NusG
MDDDIRTQELSGAPVSESDAPTGEEPADEPGEERRHSEQAFREDSIESDAEKTIDNPALAEVDLAHEEGGNTPLVDEWSGGDADDVAEEAAMHVAPDEPIDDEVAETDSVAGVTEPLGTSSDFGDIPLAETDPGERSVILAAAAEVGLENPDTDELVAEAAPIAEVEGETESEGLGRDEDVVDTDYEKPDEEVIEVPAAAVTETAEVAEVTETAELAETAAPAAKSKAKSKAKAEAEPEAEPEAETTVADPYKGPGDWYVVHTYAGYENKVKTNLSSRIHTMQMEDKIFDVHIPMEDVMEIKGGKKQVVQKKVFPGYLLVKMVYDNDSWYVVRNTPGVTGFVAAGTGSKPTPLSRREVEKILSVKKEEVKPAFRLGFEEGDVVRIISGPFADFNGTINEINVDQSKLKVLVNIFDRETPVELGFDQVAKV